MENFADACLFKSLESILKLVKRGADVNQTGVDGQNGLLQASARSNRDVISYLHSKNPQLIHSKDAYGDTAVTLACKWADLETVKLLEELGADFNQTGWRGRNALLRACSGSNREVIKYLHSRNNQLIHGRDDFGNNAVTIAYHYADLDTVELLKELGANFTREEIIDETNFAYVCKQGELEVIKKLVEGGADINQTDIVFGRNGLFKACEGSNRDVIKYLHSKNDQLIHARDKDGNTAVTLACRDADLETVKLLDKFGADFNKTGSKNRTPLIQAAHRGKLDIIEYLMQKVPGMIHSRSDLDHTAFTIAKNFATIEFMLEKLILLQDNSRATTETLVLTYQKQMSAKLSALDGAFLVTCQYGNIKTMTMMIEKLVNWSGYQMDARYKVDVASKNHEERNGFFLAALNYKTDIMHYFISKYPELTSKVADAYGIVFSQNSSEITCPNINTSDNDLTISLIDSVSQTGALKQRRIVQRLKKSIKFLENPDLKNQQNPQNVEIEPSHTSYFNTLLNHNETIDVPDSDAEEDFFQENSESLKQKFDELYRVQIDESNKRTKNHLGKGGFGEVFLANDLSNNRNVAVKIEPSYVSNPRLLYEFKIYKLLEDIDGFPKAHYYSPYGRENRLVLDLLGKSLEQIFQYMNQKFTLKDVLMIAIQSITRIQSFHEQGFIHRDIKPDNILFGIGKDKNKLFLIDFSLAKNFHKNNQHIEFEEGKTLLGTPRYCSINAATGKEQSRRDDLVSLGYVLVYLVKGGLPWQNLKTAKKLNNKEKYEHQLKIKLENSPKKLCFGLTSEFRQFLKYCMKLEFDETPDYDYLRKLFEFALGKHNLENDGKFSFFEEEENETSRARR